MKREEFKKVFAPSNNTKLKLSVGNENNPNQISSQINLHNDRGEEVYLYQNISSTKLCKVLTEIVDICLVEEEDFITKDWGSLDTITITIPINQDMAEDLNSSINQGITLIYHELVESIEKTLGSFAIEDKGKIVRESVKDLIEKLRE